MGSRFTVIVLSKLAMYHSPLPLHTNAQPLPFLHKAGSIQDFGVHHTVRTLAPRQIHYALTGHHRHIPEQLMRPADRMGRQQYVVEPTQRVRFGDRFSTAKQSIAAPAMRLALSASYNASSSTMPPRAVLIK